MYNVVNIRRINVFVIIPSKNFIISEYNIILIAVVAILKIVYMSKDVFSFSLASLLIFTDDNAFAM